MSGNIEDLLEALLYCSDTCSDCETIINVRGCPKDVTEDNAETWYRNNPNAVVTIYVSSADFFPELYEVTVSFLSAFVDFEEDGMCISSDGEHRWVYTHGAFHSIGDEIKCLEEASVPQELFLDLTTASYAYNRGWYDCLGDYMTQDEIDDFLQRKRTLPLLDALVGYRINVYLLYCNSENVYHSIKKLETSRASLRELLYCDIEHTYGETHGFVPLALKPKHKVQQERIEREKKALQERVERFHKKTKDIADKKRRLQEEEEAHRVEAQELWKLGAISMDH